MRSLWILNIENTKIYFNKCGEAFSVEIDEAYISAINGVTVEDPRDSQVIFCCGLSEQSSLASDFHGSELLEAIVDFKNHRKGEMWFKSVCDDFNPINIILDHSETPILCGLKIWTPVVSLDDVVLRNGKYYNDTSVCTYFYLLISFSRYL